MSAPRVLFVEDEPGVALPVVDRLKSEGYDVLHVEDGERGYRAALEGQFELLLLDVRLPGRGGFEILRDLRQNRVDTPVLMLTARGQVVDRVLGLKLGADDYVTKPFDLLELLARIEAVLRRRGRPAGAAGGTYTFGDVRVDFGRAQVTRAGQPVELSSLEFKLLRHFVEHRGQLCSRRELLESVWGYPAALQTRTVDVHVGTLRQKLEVHPSKPEWIVTVHRMGYRFQG